MSIDNNLYSSSMLDMIDNIVEVVVNSYFYWINDNQTREDLMQEGYLKAYELLKNGIYDPNQNLRNFLYTGVRNAMTNYNYHYSKENHSSYELYNDNIEEGSFDPNYIMSSSSFIDYTIDTDIILSSCIKFKRPEYIGNVINYFNSLGLNIENKYDICPNIDNIILKAIIVETLWSV